MPNLCMERNHHHIRTELNLKWCFSTRLWSRLQMQSRSYDMYWNKAFSLKYHKIKIESSYGYLVWISSTAVTLTRPNTDLPKQHTLNGQERVALELVRQCDRGPRQALLSIFCIDVLSCVHWTYINNTIIHEICSFYINTKLVDVYRVRSDILYT